MQISPAWMSTMLSVVISTLLWLRGITSITICCLIHEWMEVWRNNVSLHTASCDKIRDDVTNSLVPDFRNVSHSHWVLIMSSDVTECIVPSLLCRSFRWSVQSIFESWKRNYVNEILSVWEQRELIIVLDTWARERKHLLGNVWHTTVGKETNS